MHGTGAHAKTPQAIKQTGIAAPADAGLIGRLGGHSFEEGLRGEPAGEAAGSVLGLCGEAGVSSRL